MKLIWVTVNKHVKFTCIKSRILEHHWDINMYVNTLLVDHVSKGCARSVNPPIPEELFTSSRLSGATDCSYLYVHYHLLYNTVVKFWTEQIQMLLPLCLYANKHISCTNCVTCLLHPFLRVRLGLGGIPYHWYSR